MNAAQRAVPITPEPAPRRSRRRRAEPRRLGITLVGGGVLLAGLAYVAGFATLTLHSHQRGSLAKELRALQVQRRALDAQVAELKRPERIRTLAEQQGMVPYRDLRFVAFVPMPPLREFEQASAKP